MSLTVSLIAVFIPLLFMTGVVGRLFNEFAVTLSVVGRGLRRGLADADADDVRPAAAPGRRNSTRPARARRARPAFDALLAGYRRTPGLVACATSGWCCWSASRRWSARSWLYVVVPKGFLPQQDTGVLVRGDRGRAEHLDPAHGGVADASAAAIVARDPAVTGVVSFVGAGTINATPNTGRLTIALKPIGAARRRRRGDRPAAARGSPAFPA